MIFAGRDSAPHPGREISRLAASSTRSGALAKLHCPLTLSLMRASSGQEQQTRIGQ
jgi:hypothetical protein